MDELQNARYVSLTTFTRDGTPKPTPVWITGSSGSYEFVTNTDSWKTKRLRNDPTVEVRVCDMRGRIDPSATIYRGSGAVLDDTKSIDAAEQALVAKYGWQARLIGLGDGVRKLVGRSKPSSAIRLELTVDV